MQAIPLTKTIGTAEIRARDAFRFTAEIGPDNISALVDLLDVSQLSKLKFQGQFEAAKNGDVVLTADIGATVQQPCVVTLQPVKTRIDKKISRTFTGSKVTQAEDTEIEFTDGDPEDFVPDQFLLFDLLAEALALEVPEYPKIEGAELEETVFTEPGKKPMTDEDARPFAGLAALKDKLESRDSES